VEVKRRARWYVEFAARCGVNVCRMAHEDALGGPVGVSTRAYRVGAGCVSQIADIKSVFTSPQGRQETWRVVLRQWAGAQRHVFRWDDPRPGVAELVRHVRWFFGKRWRAWRAR